MSKATQSLPFQGTKRSQQFIEKYRKKLEDGFDFFNPDTSMMPVEKYNTSKLKMLLVFPTPKEVKTVSSTAAAINDYVIEHCSDVFLDFAFMPDGSDIKLYDDNHMPYAIGYITHLDASYFDVVGFSISVLHEIITGPVILRSFDRCDKPIPLFWSDRKDMKIGETPLIYAGGITAACGDVMFGKVGDKESFMDFLYLGACDKTDILLNRYIQARDNHLVIRKQEDHDIGGYPHHDEPNFVEEIKVETIQDYIESLFDLNMVYQPQAYKVVYNKHNQIIENTKINPKARDFVTPCYPHVLAEDLGIGRAIINGDGNNCGTAQTTVGEGCSSAGACSFCSEGNYCGGWVEKSKERILEEMLEAKKYSAAYKYKPYSFNCVAKGTLTATPEGFKYIQSLGKEKILSTFDYSEHKGIQSSVQPVLDLYFSQGPGLKLTSHHRQTVLTAQGLEEIKANELEVGMWVPQRIGYYKGNKVDTSSFSYLFGLWYGDGFYGGNSTYVMVDPNDVKLHEIVKNHEFCNRAVRDKDGLKVYLLKKEFTAFCKKLCPNKDDFRLCENLSLQESLEFIRGLFDADGCGSGGFLKISQKERRIDLLRDVQVVLGSVGIRSRLSLPTKVTLNGIEHVRRDVYIIGRESREAFVNILGSSEIRKICSVKTDKTKWSDKDKCIPPLFGVWTYNELKKIGAHKGHNTSKFFHGLKGLTVDKYLSLFSKFDIEPVRLIKSGIRFSQLIGIEDGGECEVIDVTETTNGRWVANGYITHNTNYLTDYKGMLKEFIQIYPKVTFINMRLEELGRDTDALTMMKSIGSNRISAPIEGISPRIQNNLLNKCLSKEALDNFMTDLIHMKLVDIKVGGIFTGYETDEDFQWLCDYVHSFKMKAKETGGNLPWRLKVTPLVHYPLTPCEYLERKSAKKSYLGEHWLTDEWYEKFRENEVFFKVNGFRYSTFIEQSIVDLGRSLTPMMYKHFIKDLAPVYSLRSVATAEFIEDLKNFIDPDCFFEARDPEHYISPGHRIHIELMGSYIPRARRLVRAYKAGDIFANDPDIRCLKTYEGAPVKCYSNCIASDPLKIYNDVTLDEEGNLHGEYRELKGCERCQTPEQKKWRLTRPTPQSANSDDIISTPRIPQVQKIRFILNRDSEYDILNPNNTAHTFVTKFLQASDTLLHAYHSIDGHNMFWQSEPAFKYFTSGYQIVDTIWSKDVISEVRSLVDKVNSELKSTKILSVQDIMFDEKLDTKDYNVYVFESTLPREIFAEATLHYKGDIKVDGGMGTLEMSNDKSLGSPVFIQKQGKVVGVFIIPVKYSPINYLSCFLSSTRKTSFQQVVDTTDFSNQFVVRETSTVCKNCGKEKGLISLITGKYLSFGKNCLAKALLTQLSK